MFLHLISFARARFDVSYAVTLLSRCVRFVVKPAAVQRSEHVEVTGSLVARAPRGTHTRSAPMYPPRYSLFQSVFHFVYVFVRSLYESFLTSSFNGEHGSFSA